MYTIRRYDIDGETYLHAKDVLESILETLRWLPTTQEQAVEIENYIRQELFEECENEHLVSEYKSVIWDWEKHV